MLTDGDIPLFNSLRDWRQKKARDAGLPPYVVFNNTQLAAIAQKRPRSLNALSLIEGVGRAKLEKYGHDLLRLIACGGPGALDEKADPGEEAITALEPPSPGAPGEAAHD